MRSQHCRFWTALQNLWIHLYATPLVAIAAIGGHCPAGGCLCVLLTGCVCRADTCCPLWCCRLVCVRALCAG